MISTGYTLQNRRMQFLMDSRKPMKSSWLEPPFPAFYVAGERAACAPAAVLPLPHSTAIAP